MCRIVTGIIVISLYEPVAKRCLLLAESRIPVARSRNVAIKINIAAKGGDSSQVDNMIPLNCVSIDYIDIILTEAHAAMLQFE